MSMVLPQPVNLHNAQRGNWSALQGWPKNGIVGGNADTYFVPSWLVDVAFLTGFTLNFGGGSLCCSSHCNIILVAEKASISA